MAEFEYNLLIVHSDRTVQESFVRLFNGVVQEHEENHSVGVRYREYLGKIEFGPTGSDARVARKLHLRTADSLLDYASHWEHHHQDVVLLNLFVPKDEAAVPSKEVGLKLLKRIKKVDPEAEVIVLSDQIFQDEAIEAIDCGAFYFIPQPQTQGIFVKALVSQVIKGKEVKHISNLDGLTGLYNRQFFDLMLRREIDAFGETVHGEEQRQMKYLSVMIIDVDRFKFFNDTYRHVEGDRALRFIAEKLSGAFRKSDIVARVGGDEFGVLLADTGHREAVQLADRARKIVRSASFHPGETGRSVALTISIGVATYPTPNRELAALYDEADRALMHGSKKAGGDSVYGYGEDGTIG